jgi:hypothetical protein
LCVGCWVIPPISEGEFEFLCQRHRQSLKTSSAVLSKNSTPVFLVRFELLLHDRRKGRPLHGIISRKVYSPHRRRWRHRHLVPSRRANVCVSRSQCKCTGNWTLNLSRFEARSSYRPLDTSADTILYASASMHRGRHQVQPFVQLVTRSRCSQAFQVMRTRRVVVVKAG